MCSTFSGILVSLGHLFSLFMDYVRLSQGNSVRTLTGLQRLLEGGLIICCVLATYILLALTSFSPSDPG